MNIKPKCCPFCGTKPILKITKSGVRIECSNESCKCFPRTWWFETVEEASEVWNKRYEE